MGDVATSAALWSIRALSYSILGYSLFYLAMSLGKWYEANILDNELEMSMKGDLEIRSSYNEKFVFIGLPIILSAALGGVYEAIWKHREVNARKSTPATSRSPPGLFAVLHNAMQYKFKPLGQYSP